MKITYFGHSCFLIENEDTRIIIDPFYDNQKFSPDPTHVLVTHAHEDHLGNAESLCTKDVLLISTFELCNYLKSKGIENAYTMQNCGFVDFGSFELKVVQALHGSSIDGIHSIGVAVGFIIKIDEKIIYHAGDTGLFGDMELIGKRNKIDIAFLPIGGTYTMDLDDALFALKLLKPKIAVPMHYNTFPVIEQDPKEFIEQTPRGVEGVIFEVGESRGF